MGKQSKRDGQPNPKLPGNHKHSNRLPLHPASTTAAVGGSSGGGGDVWGR